MDSPTIDTIDSSTIDGSAFGSSAPSSVQGEPREHSPPPTVAHVSYNNPTIPPGPIQLKRRVSSRLPVPKKSSIPTPAPINVPQPYSSLRTASSRESLVSPGPKSASPRFPSVAKRQSRIGGPSYNGGGREYLNLKTPIPYSYWLCFETFATDIKQFLHLLNLHQYPRASRALEWLEVILEEITHHTLPPLLPRGHQSLP